MDVEGGYVFIYADLSSNTQVNKWILTQETTVCVCVCDNLDHNLHIYIYISFSAFIYKYLSYILFSFLFIFHLWVRGLGVSKMGGAMN